MSDRSVVSGSDLQTNSPGKRSRQIDDIFLICAGIFSEADSKEMSHVVIADCYIFVKSNPCRFYLTSMQL